MLLSISIASTYISFKFSIFIFSIYITLYIFIIFFTIWCFYCSNFCFMGLLVISFNSSFCWNTIITSMCSTWNFISFFIFSSITNFINSKLLSFIFIWIRSINCYSIVILFNSTSNFMSFFSIVTSWNFFISMFYWIGICIFSFITKISIFSSIFISSSSYCICLIFRNSVRNIILPNFIPFPSFFVLV